MIIKFSPALLFARQAEVKNPQVLTRKNWINADRIVMMILSASAIAMAITW